VAIAACAVVPMANVATKAPTPSPKRRRVICKSFSITPSPSRRVAPPHDPVVDAAAAQIGRQSLFDLILRRTLVAIEQGLGGHDHPVGAIAALRRLRFDEGLLERMRFALGREAIQVVTAALLPSRPASRTIARACRR